MYLSRQYCPRSELQLVGITALYIAMKSEEIELYPCRKFVDYTKGTCSNLHIVKKERQILGVLKWRINPDTLYFWLDHLMKAWDSWIEQRLPSVEQCQFFRRPSFRKHAPILDPITHPFAGFPLHQPNRYRRVTQVIDLMSLDLDVTRYSRPRLAAAVLLIETMCAYNVLPDLVGMFTRGDPE